MPMDETRSGQSPALSIARKPSAGRPHAQDDNSTPAGATPIGELPGMRTAFDVGRAGVAFGLLAVLIAAAGPAVSRRIAGWPSAVSRLPGRIRGAGREWWRPSEIRGRVANGGRRLNHWWQNPVTFRACAPFVVVGFGLILAHTVLLGAVVLVARTVSTADATIVLPPMVRWH